jgi:DnaJ-domain-containing protein 1
MAVDINNDIKGVSNKIEQYDYYKDFKKDYKNLKKVYGDSFEADKKRIVQELDKYNRNTRKQNNSCTPFVEQLINQLKKLKGSGLDTEKFAKKIFLKSLKKQKKKYF